MRWEGDHLRIVLTVNDSKAIDKPIVSELSAKLRKIGCRCVLDDGRKELVRYSLPIACSNRFHSLKDDDVTIKKRDCVEVPQGGLQSRSAYHREYGLRVGSWNFSGLCSQRKQKEVSEVLNKLKLDIVAVQESWEKKGSVIEVQGYKWLGQPRKIQNSKRGEGGVGFLIRECLLAEVEFITNINLEESAWIKVRGGRGKESLYIGCIYMPTTTASVSTMDACYENLKEDVLIFKEKGKVMLLGDLNARVGTASEIDEVIGMFGEETSNNNGEKLVSFLTEVDLVACNGRTFVMEPEWTRIRPGLKQKSIIDYIITDMQMLKKSGKLCVDTTDIGISDHFLLWLELGRLTKRHTKGKRVIKKWRLDRFDDKEIVIRYKKALSIEEPNFIKEIRSIEESDIHEHALIQEVLNSWEKRVTKVAKSVIGEKTVVCGRSTKWWDEEIKGKIKQRREVYKRFRHNGDSKLWTEYCKLRKEVKQLVIEKKLVMWNNIVEKANQDFEGNKKQFWSFVGRRTKCKNKTISSLKSESGISVSSTKGKLQILQQHYQLLGTSMVDSAFDDEWKLEVEEKVLEYSKQNLKDLDLDKEIEESEIVRCINKLKNNKTGGGDGIVSELLKYGGVGMVKMLGKLYALTWKEECVPMKWREGLIVSLFKKGDKEDPGNYRGITLLSVVGKVFCKILNDRLVQYLDKSSKIHEGQAGFRAGRCCIDNIFTLNELIQGRLKEGKKTFSFFLDIQKAYDSVWRNGLWLKLWNMGVKGKMWRVIKTMYNSSRSAVLLEGEKSSTFSVEQGVAQGCSLSPILFSVFISDLLEEIIGLR